MILFIIEFTTAGKESVGANRDTHTRLHQPHTKSPFHCAQYKKTKHSLHPSPTNTTIDNGVVFGRDNS